MEMVAERAQELQKMRRAAAWLGRRSVAHALLTWRDMSSWRPHARRAVLRLVLCDLAHGFERWRSAWLESAHHLLGLRRALARLMSISIASGWNTWLHTALSRKARVHSCRCGIEDAAQKTLRQAWQLWKQMERSAAQLAGALDRAGLHASLRRMRSAWRGWAAAAARRRRLVQLERLSSNHTQQRWLVRALALWVATTAAGLASVHTMGAAATAAASKRLRCAWSSWAWAAGSAAAIVRLVKDGVKPTPVTLWDQRCVLIGDNYASNPR